MFAKKKSTFLPSNCRGNPPLKFNATGGASPPRIMLHAISSKMTARQYAECVSDTERGAPKLRRRRRRQRRRARSRGGKRRENGENLSRRFYTEPRLGRLSERRWRRCTMRTTCTSFLVFAQRATGGGGGRGSPQSRRRITALAAKRIIDASVLMASGVVYYERFSRCDANADSTT